MGSIDGQTCATCGGRVGPDGSQGADGSEWQARFYCEPCTQRWWVVQLAAAYEAMRLLPRWPPEVLQCIAQFVLRRG